jgi:hypothetical protein
MLSAPLAHVAGIPVEETALMLVPVWSGAAVVLGLRVRRARRALRRSRNDRDRKR